MSCLIAKDTSGQADLPLAAEYGPRKRHSSFLPWQAHLLTTPAHSAHGAICDYQQWLAPCRHD
jgi:hypothetical protein